MISGKMVLKDGNAIHETNFAIGSYASLAKSFVPAVLTMEALRKHIVDDEGNISPRRVASISCDLSQALYSEFEKREWLIEAPLRETETKSV